MTRRWFCSNPDCCSLLGILRDQILEIRYKAVTYVVKGATSAETICRRCGTANELRPSARP